MHYKEEDILLVNLEKARRIGLSNVYFYDSKVFVEF